MSRIAISYRRDDSAAITGRIFDRLTAHYGNDSVFRDIDNIPLGVDFREYINAMLAETDITLVIIGKRWLGPARGRRRINDPDDPVRVEVETALGQRMPVIPILVEGGGMPKVEQLPDTLKELIYRNGLDVDSGRDFDQHIERLIRNIDPILTRMSRQRAEEEQRRAEEEQRRAEEEQRRAGATQQAEEEQRRAGATQQAEEEQRRAEAAQQAEDEQRRAQWMRQAAEQELQAEKERQAAWERDRAEAARREERKRNAESARQAEQERAGETARQAEEEQRLAEAARQAEEEQRRTETAHQAEEEQRRTGVARVAESLSKQLREHPRRWIGIGVMPALFALLFGSVNIVLVVVLLALATMLAVTSGWKWPMYVLSCFNLVLFALFISLAVTVTANHVKEQAGLILVALAFAVESAVAISNAWPRIFSDRLRS
jgi:hypothetical protein